LGKGEEKVMPDWSNRYRKQKIKTKNYEKIMSEAWEVRVFSLVNNFLFRTRTFFSLFPLDEKRRGRG